MIVHLIFNTILVFLALSISVEIFLGIFRIKNFRIKYICRALPFFKIPFDLIVFTFIGESFFINLNPFSCEIFVYEFLYKLFPAQMPEASNHLIIPQYIAEQLPVHILSISTIAVIAVAFLGIMIKLVKLYGSMNYLNGIIVNASAYMPTFKNQKLALDIQNLKVKILASKEIEIPFAAHNSYIILPLKAVERLSTDEIEAVIAHEIQHLKWKDPIFKFIISLISSFCWWIPSRGHVAKLIEDQEQASDAGATSYSIDNCILATAITKILYTSKEPKLNHQTVCYLASSKKTHLNRLEAILNDGFFQQGSYIALKDLFVLVCCFLAFLSVWMC